MAVLDSIIDPDRLREYTRQLAIENGARVRARRKALGISANDLGVLTGTTVQTINKVELGQIVLRDYLRIAIAMALSQEIDELFPWPTRKTVAKAA